MTTKMMPVGSIHYFPGQNVSRHGIHTDSTATHDLIAGMAERGYDVTKPLVAYKLSDKEIKKAVAERQAILDQLKEANDPIKTSRHNAEGKTEKVSLAASDVLRTYQAMYVGDDNKIIKPTHAGVFGFHRNHCLVPANALRRLDKLPIIAELPIIVKTFKNSHERMMETIGENTLNLTEGVNKLSGRDLTAAARNLFHAGSNEAKFRRLFKAGTGQKLYAICQIDGKFPDAKIISRILDKKIDYARIDKEGARKLVKKMDEFTSETIEAHLVEDRVNDKPQMSKPDQVSLEEKNPCIVVKKTLLAVRDDDAMLHLSDVGVRAPALNACLEVDVENVDALEKVIKQFIAEQAKANKKVKTA